MAILKLNEWEVSLIRAFCSYTKFNDQEVLAYFTRPKRTVNHRVIGGIRRRKYYPDVEACSEEELSYYRDNWFRFSVSKGEQKKVEELVAKAREAMISAIQTYNNPRVSFRAEIYIVLCTISWTYVLHAFYRSKQIKYVYSETEDGDEKSYLTPGNQPKYWDLTRCLKSANCPIEIATKTNLHYLIAIRNEIEHRSTGNLDIRIASRLQAAGHLQKPFWPELLDRDSVLGARCLV
jgi:hypothetical protein